MRPLAFQRPRWPSDSGQSASIARNGSSNDRPTRCWPTGSGTRCWTADWRWPPVCRPNANWQQDFRCPGRRSALLTRCCASRAGWSPGADRAPPCGYRTPPAAPAVGGRTAVGTATGVAVRDRRHLRLAGWDWLARRTRGGDARIACRSDPADFGVIDLTTASLPAPAEPLAAAVAAAAAELPRYLSTDGYQPFGLPVLRQAIAERYAAAGVPTTAEQILVTSGAQHAFTLILGELSAPGDRVLIECPTYPVVLDAVRAHRRTPAPVGLAEPRGGPFRTEESAWDVELFSATLRQTAPRLGYLIPDFQNPTGALMDVGTREALVAAARSARTVLLADESFRDVPFPGHRATAATAGRLRPGRDQGAVARIGLEGILGRPAGGLDQGGAGAGAATGHRARARRYGRARPRSTRRHAIVVESGRRAGPATVPTGHRCGRPAGGAGGAAAGLATYPPQGGASLWVQTARPLCHRPGTAGAVGRRPDRARPPVRARRHHGVLLAAAVHHAPRSAWSRRSPGWPRSPIGRLRAPGRRCPVGWPDGSRHSPDCRAHKTRRCAGRPGWRNSGKIFVCRRFPLAAEKPVFRRTASGVTLDLEGFRSRYATSESAKWIVAAERFFSTAFGPAASTEPYMPA